MIPGNIRELQNLIERGVILPNPEPDRYPASFTAASSRHFRRH